MDREKFLDELAEKLVDRSMQQINEATDDFLMEVAMKKALEVVTKEKTEPFSIEHLQENTKKMQFLCHYSRYMQIFSPKMYEVGFEEFRRKFGKNIDFETWSEIFFSGYAIGLEGTNFYENCMDEFKEIIEKEKEKYESSNSNGETD